MHVLITTKSDRLFILADKLTEYSLYCMVFFIPFSKAGIEISFGFLFLGFLIKKFLKPDFRFLNSPINITVIFFIFFNALSLFNSGPFLTKSLNSLFSKWIEYVIIFFIVQDIMSGNRNIRRNVIFLILGVSIFIILDGLFQRFNGVDLIRGKKIIPITEVSNNMYGISASFNHYNDFGIYLVFILSFTMSLLVSKVDKRIPLNKFVLMILEILSLVCLLLTFSRGAWLGFLLVLIIMLFLTSYKTYVLLTLLIFISALLMIPGLKERIMFTFQGQGDAGRFLMWQATFKMIQENPFLGKGVGTFMDYFHRYVPQLYVQYAHNCYLQMWAEAGIFTLLCFLIFTGLILYKGLKIFRKTQDSFILGSLYALIAFLVHSFFDTHFYSLQLSVLFWLILGLLAGYSRLTQTDRQGERIE